MKTTTLVLLSFLSITNVLAQDYLFDTDLEIASHKRKASSVNFSTSSGTTPEEIQKNTVIGYLFKPGDNDPYEGMDEMIMLYHNLPTCSEDKVILNEVFHHTEGSEAIDFIVYNYQDSSQSKLAKSQERVVVPWDPNYDPSAGYTSMDAQFQDLARVMSPDCLPTSFRYIYSGSKRYREARTGSKAWE